MKRRTFAQYAAGLLGYAGLGRRASGLERIGIQLYTVRDIFAKRSEPTLVALARAGYREVEFAGYHGMAPRAVRTILDRNGLTAPSAHVDLEDIRSRWPATLDAAKTIGHRYLVLAYLSQADRQSLDDYRRVADQLNTAAATAKAVGITMAYHNHDFEFAPIDGQVPYNLLLSLSDPSLVKLELDLYWIAKGGADPLRYFAKWPGRFPMVHVKDMSKDPSEAMVDLGAGRIDFAKIFAQAPEAGIKHYFVEHDQPPDPLRFARDAATYLKKLEVTR